MEYWRLVLVILAGSATIETTGSLPDRPPEPVINNAFFYYGPQRSAFLTQLL